MATITSSLASLGSAMEPLDQEITNLSVQGQKQRMLESVMGSLDPVAMQQVQTGYFATSTASLLADANIMAILYMHGGTAARLRYTTTNPPFRKLADMGLCFLQDLLLELRSARNVP